MKLVYLLPILPPRHPECEAYSQEIALLQSRFGGRVVFVNPNQHLPLPIPRLGFGLAQLPSLRRAETEETIYHFFNPDPFVFPFLLGLRRPVVYTIAGGMDAQRVNLRFLRRMAVVAVPDARSLARLQAWGLDNVHWQRPGIDTTRFTHHPLTPAVGAALRVVVASAPWTPAQFAGKGFDALLAAAQQMPELHLTLLWRGVLVDEIWARVAAAGVGAQVEVIDGPVDVNAVLARAHAAALLATRPGLVKSFPHSLLDALAAGKPVLISRAIPMADYVAETGCGMVVDSVTPRAICAGLTELRAGYEGCRRAAETVGRRDFSQSAALEAVAAIYQTAQAAASPGRHAG